LPDPISKRKEVNPMSDDFFDIGWEEMALAGSLSEELAEEEKERLRRKREMEQDDCDCCCEECDPCDPRDQPFEPPDEDPEP
jgi:hypothetical protein